ACGRAYHARCRRLGSRGRSRPRRHAKAESRRSCADRAVGQCHDVPRCGIMMTTEKRSVRFLPPRDWESRLAKNRKPWRAVQVLGGRVQLARSSAAASENKNAEDK